jgi:hypothetical protein
VLYEFKVATLALLDKQECYKYVLLFTASHELTEDGPGLDCSGDYVRTPFKLARGCKVLMLESPPQRV